MNAAAESRPSSSYGLSGASAKGAAGGGRLEEERSNFSDATARGAQQAVPEPLKASAPAPAAKKLESMSLGSRAQESASDSAADTEALIAVEKAGADGEAKLAARKREQAAATGLDAARAAATKGDLAGQVRFAAEALALRPVGSQRLDALRFLCDGYEGLGQWVQADPYCDALLSEFPGSSAAQALTRRRGAQQRAPAGAEQAPQPASSH